MGQSRLHALVIVTTGRRTFCSWLPHGPQSKGQPCSTSFFTTRGGVFFGSIARVRSYQAASLESVTSWAPCSGHVFLMTTSDPTATTRAATAFLQVLQRLVVSWRSRS